MAEVGPIELSAGSWKTLVSFWGRIPTPRTGFFRGPPGVVIKVRYGYGWFGFDRQKQTLDGETTKTLRVSGWVGYARFQARSSTRTQITFRYEVEGP